MSYINDKSPTTAGKFSDVSRSLIAGHKGKKGMLDQVDQEMLDILKVTLDHKDL